MATISFLYIQMSFAKIFQDGFFNMGSNSNFSQGSETILNKHVLCFVSGKFNSFYFSVRISKFIYKGVPSPKSRVFFYSHLHPFAMFNSFFCWTLLQIWNYNSAPEAEEPGNLASSEPSRTVLHSKQSFHM